MSSSKPKNTIYISYKKSPIGDFFTTEFFTVILRTIISLVLKMELFLSPEET